MARPDWYTITDAGNGIIIIQEWIGVEDVKSFLVEGENDVAVLDTGAGVGDFAGLVARLSEKDPLVLQSHSHWDHIGDSHRFARVLIHPDEADDLRHGTPNEDFSGLFGPGGMEYDRLPEGYDPASASIPGTDPTGWLIEGDTFDLGGRVLTAHHTPGHSPGGMTLLDPASRTLFPGDAINLGEHYVYYPDSNPADWRRTLEKLVELSKDVDILRPSHGPEMTPDDVRQIHTAYEDIWAGNRKADDQRSAETGTDESTVIDVFEFDRFSFQLPAGRYGPDAAG
jgi:glyoxylase-like metal-dependent hydrolase (beta-lactamase superfamily II)